MPRETQRNYVGGKWVDAASGERIDVLDPATDERLATVPYGDGADASRAIDAAAEALVSWRHETGRTRGRLLGRLYDLIDSEREELAHTITLEQGKPLREALGEVDYGAGFIQWAAEEAPHIYGDVIPSARPEKRLMALRQPVGVTAAITPWNFPLAMLTRKVGPALAAGCTQVIKPASATPLTAIALCELIEEAGFPPGTVNLVCGAASEISDALFSDPRVRKVSFTGSTEVGRNLIHASAGNIVRLSLELGGHAPLLVLDDADLDEAIPQIVRAKFRNAGQSCISPNRFYVARPIYEDMIAGVSEEVRKMTVGPGLDNPDVGALIDDKAVAKVSEHVADALGRGASLEVGGELVDMGDGFTDRFYAPTVLRDVTPEMLISNEETFGPVIGFTPFDSDAEAIEMANDSPYGLAAYLFSQDPGRIMRTAEALECGVLGVNDGGPSTPQAPFGGVKASGYGREGGRYVMDEYLETKFVSWNLGDPATS